MAQVILDVTDSVGEFSHPGGEAFILIRHNGGTWKVQFRDPDDTVWIDDDPTLEATESQMVLWHGSPELKYRLAGGDLGAKAWLLRNSHYAGV